MLYAAPFKHTGQNLGFFNRDRTDKHRLSLFVTGDYLVYNSVEFRFFGFVYNIVLVHTGDRLVCGYFDNVELVNLLKLGFLGHGGTCHARQLIIKPEEVLECNCGKRFRLARDLYALFRLNRLMKSLIVAPAVHKAAGELVDDYYLAVLYDIVDITLHNAVGAYRLVDMVGNSYILCIVQVFYIEKFFCLFNARRGKGGGVRLFVHYIVAVVIGLLVARLIVHFLDLYHFKG